MVAIGIDLGTTYTCFGVWSDETNSVNIIPNDHGNRTTPSYVAFSSTDNNYYVGDSAKLQQNRNIKGTLYDSKRLIGRVYDDPNNIFDVKFWPFNIVNNNGKPYYCVEYNQEIKHYSAEEISSMILARVKTCASKYFGEEIVDAVITVPAYFNDFQRQSTKNAAAIAGLNVLRIINEPTAAALAYGLNKKNISNVLIFDCGGGTHDVTLLELDNGLFEVLATCGNSHLGGRDFDNKLLQYCIDDFNSKFHTNIENNSRSIEKLKTECEKTKRLLSELYQVTIDIENLYDGHDYIVNISRSKFEELCDSLFRETLYPVDNVLTDANLSCDKIDEIVLVGGSTRIPKIKELLSKKFGGKQLNESINPDEAVAYGAAIHAAMMTNTTSNEKLGGLTLVDVTPLSLGLETRGGFMTNIIDRNSQIPCKKSKEFTTEFDNQPSVVVQIFEGERGIAKYNNLLGSFQLDGITPSPKGVPRIEVTFSVDHNGIFEVTAVEKMSGNSKAMIITNNNRFNDDDINKMIEEAKKFEEIDKTKRRNLESKTKLENYVYGVINLIKKNIQVVNIDALTKTKLFQKLETIRKTIDSDEIENYDIYDTKKRDLEEFFTPILVKIQEIHTREQEL
jgi:heat shock 70kDa protein 1/2/6/8